MGPRTPAHAAPSWAVRALALVCLACVACQERAPEGTPNLLLLVVDTLRADHLGAYGYERPTSPRFDAVAAEGSLYTRAFASAPWTLPSHASLFTGLDPFEHGAHSFLPDGPGRNVYPLAATPPTLAGTLREVGFATAAFVANEGYLGEWTGLGRGFEIWNANREPALQLNERVFTWLDRPRTGPFFVFVNYMDAHRPYNTQPVARLQPAAERDEALLDQLVANVLGDDEPVSDALVRRVIAQYDTGVANADDGIGHLLDGLAERGLLENTVVVLTSDHGEYFGEHRLVEHSKDVYQGALWVPLVIRGAGAPRPERVEVPVSSANVPHLIAFELGPVAERVAEHFPRAPGWRSVLAENYFTRKKDLAHPRWGARFRRIRRASYAWPFKHISSSDGRDELYDLASDPGETRNLIESSPEVGDQMQQALEARLGERREHERVRAAEPTAEELEELRALGYVE